MNKYSNMLSAGLGLSTIAVYRFIEDMGGIVNEVELVNILQLERPNTKIRYHLDKLIESGYLQKIKEQGRVMYLCA
jgi:Fic family protein